MICASCLVEIEEQVSRFNDDDDDDDHAPPHPCKSVLVVKSKKPSWINQKARKASFLFCAFSSDVAKQSSAFSFT